VLNVYLARSVAAIPRRLSNKPRLTWYFKIIRRIYSPRVLSWWNLRRTIFGAPDFAYGFDPSLLCAFSYGLNSILLVARGKKGPNITDALLRGTRRRVLCLRYGMPRSLVLHTTMKKVIHQLFSYEP
jgi:hypothetical protein